MTDYEAGDIVLVDFGFSEGTGSKKRPALVISTRGYHKSRAEVIVAAITSSIRRVLAGDTRIQKWKDAGLIHPSLVTGIIRTTKRSVIVRKLGVLSEQDFTNVGKSLRRVLAL